MKAPVLVYPPPLEKDVAVLFPLSVICLAGVAQLVEQRTHKPRVGGSIPPSGNVFLKP